MAGRENVIGGFISSTFGFRGRRNLLAWGVAGSLAYYFYVVPVRKRNDEQERVREQAKQWAEEAAGKQ